MSDELVAVTTLPDCYVRLGWFKRAPLLWMHYKGGRSEIVYPIYPGPKYVPISASRPDLLRDPVEAGHTEDVP